MSCAFGVWAVTLAKQFSYNAGFCMKNAVRRAVYVICAEKHFPQGNCTTGFWYLSVRVVTADTQKRSPVLQVNICSLPVLLACLLPGDPAQHLQEEFAADTEVWLRETVWVPHDVEGLKLSMLLFFGGAEAVFSYDSTVGKEQNLDDLLFSAEVIPAWGHKRFKMKTLFR